MYQRKDVCLPPQPDLLISGTLCLLQRVCQMNLVASFWGWSCETQHQIIIVLP